MWLSLAWAWLKKWWWAIAGGALTLFGALLGSSLKKPVIIDTSDPAKKKAEQDAEKQAAEAVVTRDAEQKAAEDAHTKDVTANVDAEKKRVDALEADPTALNDYLKQVGKDTRGP